MGCQETCHSLLVIFEQSTFEDHGFIAKEARFTLVRIMEFGTF